jgi:hypothetical protein
VEGTAKAVACRRWLRVAAADQFTWADGYAEGLRDARPGTYGWDALSYTPFTPVLRSSAPAAAIV